jgi:hypothetical protein
MARPGPPDGRTGTRGQAARVTAAAQPKRALLGEAAVAGVHGNRPVGCLTTHPVAHAGDLADKLGGEGSRKVTFMETRKTTEHMPAGWERVMWAWRRGGSMDG